MPPIAQELVESSLEKAGATDALAIADGSSVPQLALAAASPASGKSKEAAKMLHSAVACEARTRLRNKTALVARSGLDMLRKIVTMRNKELNKAENDLTYLKEMLAEVQQPLVEASWKDRVESWIELAALLPKLRSERGVAVLECVFADAEVTKALGLAKMFLNATGVTPDSLMVILNQSLGKHIKANACTRHTAPLLPPVAQLPSVPLTRHTLPRCAQTATVGRSTESSRPSSASTRTRRPPSNCCGPSLQRP